MMFNYECRIPGGRRWALLLIGIFGYVTLNRGFAYIGVYPIFWGELCLIFYLLTTRHSIALPRFLNTLAGKLLLVFLIYSFLLNWCLISVVNVSSVFT